ncbi:MAG: beta galactosidase jelly roll domain-containing protein [Chloroflexi bacterium]|nr:beta galactosidase jelly roll domain-containing protein [Chloroflexota bacterium]
MMREEISLAGLWRYHTGDPVDGDAAVADYDDTGWPEMELPANWHLRGLEAHGAVWFRQTMALPTRFAGRHLRLCFDGVDYFADVWLNGSYLGRHEGYFQPFAFDVSAIMRPDEPNVLAVRVDSPWEAFGAVWHLRKRLVKGILNHHDTRPGGGWGIQGQELNTGGIWNDVRLLSHEAIRLDGVHVIPRLTANHRRATVDVVATVENHSTEPVEVHLVGVVMPENFGTIRSIVAELGARVTVQPGRQQVRLSTQIDRPALWWSWDLGEPNLYRLDLVAESIGSTLDRLSTRFGIRSVSVDADWVWRLNGQRIFLRGTNYIPTQWLAEMDEAAFRRDANLMREANVNVVRVHAHVNRDELYRVADEAGLLVWQDFALQWGYDDSETFKQSALRQQREMIEQLHNHPSIAVWCCHNESPWAAPWMAEKVPDYDPDQNRDLDERLAADARRLDPTRVVHLSSGTGDAHAHVGWYSGNSMWDFRDLPGAPFVTEFGAQALPSALSLARIFPPEQLWPPDWDAWAFHDFQREETFDNAGIAIGATIEEFVANSQAYQARLTQYAVECYRRAKWRPMTGVFQFMFVDGWPSITWSVLDRWRQPKAGFDALRRAFQPVLPSAECHADRFPTGEAVQLPLWVINDLPRPLPDSVLHWALVRGGKVCQTGEERLDVPADAVIAAGHVAGDPALPHGDYVLQLRLVRRGGKTLSANETHFTIGQEASR